MVLSPTGYPAGCADAFSHILEFNQSLPPASDTQALADAYNVLGDNLLGDADEATTDQSIEDAISTLGWDYKDAWINLTGGDPETAQVYLSHAQADDTVLNSACGAG